MLDAVQDLFFSQVASQADMVVGVDVSRKLLLKAKEQAKAFGERFCFAGGC